MPTYQYACTECGHAFEQFQSFSDDALTECPECPGRLRKLFNAVGVVFKGSGFYRTDSRCRLRLLRVEVRDQDGRPRRPRRSPTPRRRRSPRRRADVEAAAAARPSSCTAATTPDACGEPSARRAWLS